MASGIQNMYLPVNGNAASAKRLSAVSSFFSSTGWWKFLSIPLAEYDNFNIVILIVDMNINFTGICRLYKASTGTAIAEWMSYPPDYRRICVEQTEDAVNYYLYKGNGSANALTIELLYSLSGISYLELADYWVQTKVSSSGVASPPANTTPAGIYGHYWGVCDTEAATAAKTVTILNFPTTIPDGTEIRVQFTTDQSATSPTLNVNDIGAYPIRMYVTSSTAWDVPVDYWTAGDYVTLVFNVTNSCWVVTGKSGKASTGNYGYTKLSSAIDSTSTALAATPSAVKQAYDLAAAALPATGTALRAGRLASLFSLTGGSGWYKIMDFTIETSNNSSRNFVLVIMDTYQTYTGIAKINFRRTSSTEIECSAQWVALNGQYIRAFAYTVDGSTGKCELYFRKATSTTYDTKFQCIASTTLNTWIEATAIPWYTDGAAAPVSALPENAVITISGNIADRAYRMVPAKYFTGNAGWYKFFEISLSSNQRYQFTFLIGFGNAVRKGLLSCSLSRTSSTAGAGWAGWISAYSYIVEAVKYDYTFVDGVATLSLYINKPDNSSYGISIEVLQSTSMNGAPASPYPYFIETPTIVTVPSTAKVAYFPTNTIRCNNVAVSAGTNQQIISISDTDIRANYVLSRIEFANPEYITTGYTWTTTDGGFTLTGTCTAATTANILFTLSIEK